MADIGALLSGISGSLAQGRDYNLAVARARQSAGLRLRGIELQERESELNRLRVQQGMEETRIKTLAETADLKAQIADEKRKSAARETIEEYEEAVSEPLLSAVREIKEGRPVLGGPERRVRRLGRKAASAYETLGREVPARLEEQLLTPTQRRARKADIELTEAQIAESERRAARPVGGTETQIDRDRRKLLDINTPEAEKRLIERRIFGNTMMVDGVPTTEISRMLNDVYPEVGGIRPGLSEKLESDPIKLYRHVAQLVKELQGDAGLVPDPDADITVDSLFVPR